MMLSRVASRIYWFARYVERAENTARIISVNTNLMLDIPQPTALGWEPIVDIMGCGAAFKEHVGEATERQVVKFLLSDPNNASSILNSMRNARENARTIRDVLPAETWELVNEWHLYVKNNATKGLSQRTRFEFLKNVIMGAQQLTGMLAGTMYQDQGYDFVRIGRNLERADMTTRILDVRSINLLPETDDQLAPFEQVQWVSVLKSLSAYQMYRRCVQEPVRRADVLAFLLTDPNCPRSVLQCLNVLTQAVSHLPRNRDCIVAIKALQAELDGLDTSKLVDTRLKKCMDELQIGLASLHNVINETYFVADLSQEAPVAMKKAASM